MTENLNGQERISRRRQEIKSFRARADAKRTTSERFADWMTPRFGSVLFLTVNVLWFAVWISYNTGLIPGAVPFDPFPFGLLTTMVSLEAIVLAIVVLISQNRSARVDEIREEVELYISTHAEAEITKVIKLLVLLLEKNGVDVSQDPEVKSMLKNLRSEDIERRFENQIKG